MRKILKALLYYHLYFLVKIVLFFKKPYIVLVLGGENKSMIREKLKNIGLEKGLNTWKKYRPYNTWFGITLTILDLPSKYSDYTGWIWVYLLSFVKFVKALFSTPEYLFLEAGIDSQGEAKKFINLLRPKVVIFGSIEHNFDDDLKDIDVIENEFYTIATYINKKSDGYSKFDKTGNLETIIEMIKSGERFFCAINTEYPRLKNISDKIIRKIDIK